jgi:uroporphyrinogen-III synthase
MKRLVVLRPEPGATDTVERAQTMGLDAYAMPLFVVEPVGWDVPGPNEFDALLLTSANAVRHGGSGLEQMQNLPVYAVGEATADAARETGFEVAAIGDGGVDKLLGSIPPEVRLLHLCGEHHLAAGRATSVPVYRSAVLPPPDDLQDIEDQVVAIHSPRAGRRLAELVGEEIGRATIQVAAISAAAAAAAGDGWAVREAAETPDDWALLALAARLCDRGVTT